MIHIIAVSYFGSKDVEMLVRSLEAQSVGEWRLTVVDNSVDMNEYETLLNLTSDTSAATVVANKENSGYFGGAQFALRNDVTSQSGDDWTIVCNTDLVVDGTKAFESLMQYEDQEVGVIAPSIRSVRSGRDQNPYMRDRPSRRAQLRRKWQARNRGLAQVSILISGLRRKSKGGAKVPASIGGLEIYAAHGSAMIFSKLYFERGGSIAHPLFLFGEELFVAEQCRKLGLRTVYEPRIGIIHEEHKQTGVLRSRRVLDSMVEGASFGYSLLYGGDQRR